MSKGPKYRPHGRCRPEGQSESAKLRSDGLPISSLLVPPAFGPFQQPDSPISMIIYRAIEGETIPVVNPEEKVSDLVYVKDVVDAIVLVEKNGKIGGFRGNCW